VQGGAPARRPAGGRHPGVVRDDDPEDRLRRLGLTLPSPPPALAHYELAVRTGSLLFLAGHAPLRDGEQMYVGKVGREWSEADGYDAARLTALNMLATLEQELGDLRRIRRIVKLFGMVNCTEQFTRVPDVMNGASDLFIEVFGDAGRHARSAVGMQQLHYGMAIEIEGVFEVGT
jgi:enamine deaminase RidA (YjgF/YER057c/UK114 family)